MVVVVGELTINLTFIFFFNNHYIASMLLGSGHRAEMAWFYGENGEVFFFLKKKSVKELKDPHGRANLVW